MHLQTTRLSVYLKFGVVSPREAYYYFKKNKTLYQQLIWRDFYYTYYYFNRNSIVNGDNMNVISKVKWENNKEWIKAWKTGKTGIPIVDAGMRQLVSENFMHNRARRITASTLYKLIL